MVKGDCEVGGMIRLIKKVEKVETINKRVCCGEVMDRYMSRCQGSFDVDPVDRVKIRPR